MYIYIYTLYIYVCIYILYIYMGNRCVDLSSIFIHEIGRAVYKSGFNIM